jgi:hypothetical protein
MVRALATLTHLDETLALEDDRMAALVSLNHVSKA